MPNKMIPFSYEIKITHSDFCYYGIYYSNEDRHSGRLFLFHFIVCITIALGHGVAQKFNGLT